MVAAAALVRDLSESRRTNLLTCVRQMSYDAYRSIRLERCCTRSDEGTVIERC
jgi:glucan biosynthesis protein